MPKEPICDCGKPISECKCEGHNHKKPQKVTKRNLDNDTPWDNISQPYSAFPGSPYDTWKKRLEYEQYLSMIGEGTQKYADHIRNRTNSFIEINNKLPKTQKITRPFGVVLDIEGDSKNPDYWNSYLPYKDKNSFYTPSGSAGSSMTKREKKQTPPPPDPNDPVNEILGLVGRIVNSASAAGNAVIRRGQGNAIYDSKTTDKSRNAIEDAISAVKDAVVNYGTDAIRAAKDADLARGRSYSGKRNGRNADQLRVYPSGGNWRNPESEAGLAGFVNNLQRGINRFTNTLDENFARPIRNYNEREKKREEARRNERADDNIRYHVRTKDLGQEIYYDDAGKKHVLDVTSISYDPRKTPAYPSGGNWYDPESETGIEGAVKNVKRKIREVTNGDRDKQSSRGMMSGERGSAAAARMQNKKTKTERGNASMTKRVAKCPDCGKPEQLCRCEEHASMHGRGRSKMSKAMCTCGSGMTKAMCKCGGMGKRGSIAKTSIYPPPPPSPDPIQDLLSEFIERRKFGTRGNKPELGDMRVKMNYPYNDPFGGTSGRKSSTGSPRGMMKRGNVTKARIPFPPPPPDPFIHVYPPYGGKKNKGSGDIYGTVMSFAGQLPAKMKDMLGLGDMYDIFNDSPMKLSGRRIGKGLQKSKPLPPPPFWDGGRKSGTGSSRGMLKRGNVAKTSPFPTPPPSPIESIRWPWESEFEHNGGNVGQQRSTWFGYDPTNGFGNGPLDAAMQMMPTPHDTALFDSHQKEQALASAFGDLMGAYGDRIATSLGDSDWRARQGNKLKSGWNDMFPNRQRAGGTSYKRLSKSMKMDSDMAKTPQKVTPKRTIRHTDKYFK